MRHPQLLDARRSRLGVIDLQERFLPHIDDVDRVLKNTRRLVQAADAMAIPKLVTEQSPEKLGPTDPSLASSLPAAVAKTRFSSAESFGLGTVAGLAADSPEEADERSQIVLCGIETHICVLQTALDLQADGWQPYVVSDACSSREAINHRAAIARLLHHGIDVVTTEMVLFEWLEDADHTAFRTIRDLVK